MKKRKKAAALKYDLEQEEGVPRLIAVGDGYVAEKIIEVAKKERIPLVEDVEVVSKLVCLPVGAEIPEELYEAIARILIFIYKLERESRP
ncbi:MAG: EscU/YscU/HrcU family type III secretion system export apparatus switch protein [Clostridia bacterium]|nr:EscU/YscU/HrcU family type III secretion system export apparatus switch protein [Clostridia bacterium]MDD4145749.1 EscU/YscU/HrcU family type III secretion system export apparatus switch protein [Clostridia bacterium]